MRPQLYSIPVGENHLICSPWQGFYALLNKTAAREVAHFCQEEQTNISFSFPVKNIISDLSNTLMSPPNHPKGSLAPAFLGLIPTRACNMSCQYCDFGASKAPLDKMPLSMAVAAVDWMADYVKQSGLECLEIHFFGGEPFIALDVVETTLHKARMRAAELGLSTHFEVSTNGFFGRQTAQFVGDYFNSVVVSIDGFETDHNRNRPVHGQTGSFSNVCKTIHRLAQSTVELCLRCCITRDNVGQMEEITHWFCREFQPAVINFETVSENPLSRASGIYPPDPYEFTRHCVLSRRVAQQYGVNLIYASACTDTLQTSFCPVGKDTLIVSPDGRINSCYLNENEWEERGMDFCVGNLTAEGKVNIDVKAIERLRQWVCHKPGCDSCFCRWNCSGGCHVKHDVSADRHRESAFCIQTRLITVCFMLEEMQLEHVADNLLADFEKMKVLTDHMDDRLLLSRPCLPAFFSDYRENDASKARRDL